MDQQYIDTIKEIKKKPTIEKVVKLLMQCNYRFVHMNFIQTQKVFKKIKFEKAHKKYQFMVRMDHIDEDPTKDKYNFDFMVGIRFYDKRKNLIHIYYKGKFVETIKIPWAITQTQNMKKKKVPLKFPDPMSIQDRIDWRRTHDKFNKGKDIPKDELDYYLKWKPHIENIDKEENHLK
jgi:hypothetical protein